MPDTFKGSGASLISPAIHIEAVTVDVDLVAVSRGLSIATAGALELIMQDGSTAIVPSGGLAPGVIHPIRITRVVAAGTTATGITAYS